MKMKVLLALLLIAPIVLNAQKTQWLKAITASESKVSNSHKVCTDSENNFYVMASFTGNIMFGNIELKSKNKTGPTDVFLAKIDPEGNQIHWGIQITGSGNIEGKAICSDKQNNIFVSGSFEGETTFGSVTIKPKAKTGFFIAKYNSNGDFLWVKQGGNYYTKAAGSAYAIAVKSDNSGNVYLAANVVGMYDDWKYDASVPVEKQYLGKAYFEDQEIVSDDLYTGNHTLIIKLSADGDFVWRRHAGINMFFKDLAIDDNGNSYLTGHLLGISSYEGKQLPSNGLQDILVIKYDVDGKTAWIKQFGKGKPINSGAYATKAATDLETANFIDTDESGNIYISGQYYDGAKFDDQILSSDANIGGAEVGNAFICKLDANGKVQWIKNAEGKGLAAITGMACDKTGNSYIFGIIGGKKITFDGKKARGPFIAKFDANGETKWIDDADTREMSLAKTVKTDISWPGGLAINSTGDFLYGTGNAVKQTITSDLAFTYTLTETIIAAIKVKTK